MDGEDTGFKDKQGKPIHYGDILQTGLGISDRKRKQVIRFGKHTHLVDANDPERKYGGYKLTEQQCQHIVVLDHLHPPFI